MKMVPSLAVLNSGGAKLEGGKLTMTGIAPNSIVFADRPVRAAGHVLTADFIKQWDEGNDSFAKDPPNATISVMNRDGSAIEDAVVVLKAPKLEGDTLTFDVTVLEGDLAGANGPASLFIDWFAARGGFGRVAVAGGLGWHAPAWHGGWYGHPGAYYGAGLATGAVIGAAAASAYHPYYPPRLAAPTPIRLATNLGDAGGPDPGWQARRHLPAYRPAADTRLRQSDGDLEMLRWTFIAARTALLPRRAASRRRSGNGPTTGSRASAASTRASMAPATPVGLST